VDRHDILPQMTLVKFHKYAAAHGREIFRVSDFEFRTFFTPPHYAALVKPNLDKDFLFEYIAVDFVHLT